MRCARRVRHVGVDTNVFISAYVSPSPTSTARRALNLVRSQFVLCVSAEIEGEMREVFARPKIRCYETSAGAIDDYLEAVLAGAVWVTPIRRITEATDPTDNPILEAALEADAIAIVTGDKGLRTITPWRGIQILSPSEFLVHFGLSGQDLPTCGRR